MDSSQSKRGRKLTACERCRRRKIKCDNHRPCTNCVKRKVDCGDDFGDAYEDHFLIREIQRYKDLEAYWKKQLEIMTFTQNNPVRSPLTNKIISSKIIHLMFALFSSNPKIQCNTDLYEAQTEICIEAFQSHMSIIVPGFICSFNLILASQFWALLTQTNLFTLFFVDEDAIKEDDQELSFKIALNMEHDDIISILEYNVSFIRGCYILGWKEIESKLVNNCRTMLKRLFFFFGIKGMDKGQSERLLHCLLIFGGYHELNRRYGASSTCYILGHHIMCKFGTSNYDPNVVIRLYCSLIWSSKTKKERDLWMNYLFQKLPRYYDLHPFTFLIGVIGTELRLNMTSDVQSLKLLEHYILQAEYSLKYNKTTMRERAIFKESSHIFIMMAKAELCVRYNLIKESLKIVESVHQRLESMDDITLAIILNQIGFICNSMTEFSCKYQRDDGTWVSAFDELERRISYIPTPPKPSPEEAIKWKTKNQKMTL